MAIWLKNLMLIYCGIFVSMSNMSRCAQLKIPTQVSMGECCEDETESSLGATWDRIASCPCLLLEGCLFIPMAIEPIVGFTLAGMELPKSPHPDLILLSSRDVPLERPPSLAAA